MKEEVGSGGFAVVKRCVEKSTGFDFAVKIFNTKGMKLERLFDIVKEARICRKLQHPNIVQLHENVQDGDMRYLVFEYITGGDLMTNLAKRMYYNEAMASHYMQETLQGVQYCHEQNIIHADLKPENLLLTSDAPGATLKLADFGLASEIKEKGELFPPHGGTPDYMSPETFSVDGYGKPLDIWSCGIILYILLFGGSPFGDIDDENKLIDSIKHHPIIFPTSEKGDEASPAVKDLVNKMLCKHPKYRITASEALKHPWIRHREREASTANRQNTIDRLKAFNAIRKFKAAVYAAMVAPRKAPRESAVE